MKAMRTSLLFATMASVVFTSVAAAAERKPNILIILADDLGYADLGFQGIRDIPTPSLDALAQSGVRFTSGYVSASWCSPTRAGLLTGRYQERWAHEPPAGAHGGGAVVDQRAGSRPLMSLPLSETTLADRLRAAGYATGIVGKWHLGTSPDFHPLQRGFDEFFGHLGGGHSYQKGLPNIVFPDRTGAGEDYGSRMEGNILRGTESVEEPEYLTDAFGREAVSFIERHKNDPFFLYLSFNAVHTPMHADEARLAKFASIEDPVRRVYAAMTMAMDEAIGRVLAKLRQVGLEEDTLIFFLSDNGGLYWLTVGQMAVRRGDWKLVRYMQKIDEGDVHRSENPPLTPHRLYNLRDDIGATRDLAASETAKVEELKALWNQWNATMAGPQQRQTQVSPSRDRAPFILTTLDTDGDEKISEVEAQGALKQNFAFIDSNGDGGIDLGELETVLARAAGQTDGSSSQESDANAPQAGSVARPS